MKLLFVFIIIIILIFNDIVTMETIENTTSISVKVDDIDKLLNETNILLGSSKNITIDKMKGIDIELHSVKMSDVEMEEYLKNEDIITINSSKLRISNFDDYKLVMDNGLSIDAPNNNITVLSNPSSIIIRGFETRKINDNNNIVISGSNINITGITDIIIDDLKDSDNKEPMTLDELKDKRTKIRKEINSYSWISKIWYEKEYDKLKEELQDIEDKIKVHTKN